MKKTACIPIALAVLVLIILLRILFPERSMDAVGPRAVLDAVFALGLLLLVLLIALSLGKKVLRRLRVDDLSSLEQPVFEIAIGLGILSCGLLTLGLLQQLNRLAISVWLLLSAVLGTDEWTEVLGSVNTLWGVLTRKWKGLHSYLKIYLGLAALIFLTTLFMALTPPFDYDDLMYHIQGPRLFLQMGKIAFVDEPWPANLPFTIQILSTIGLSFDTDTFAKLTNLSFSFMVILATFTAGERFCTKLTGWIASALLLGMPVLPLWSENASNNMGWTLYAFLALYALLLWNSNQRPALLLLSSLMMGFALGGKYLSLAWLFTLTVLVFWQSYKHSRKRLIINLIIFVVPALMIASPWYLKNWLWAGNPVFPVYFGGLGWDKIRLDMYMTTYMDSFGVGKKPIDFLLLIWNIYARHQYFSLNSLEIPSFFFPLALLYPAYRKNGAACFMGLSAGLYIFFWFLGTQHTRYLLPVFPSLSILAASVALRITQNFRLSLKRILAVTLIGSMVIVTLAYQMVSIIGIQPQNVVLGFQSKKDFLNYAAADFPAFDFARQNLPPESRILLMWDGRSYYCTRDCIGEGEQFYWVRLVYDDPDVDRIAAHLNQMGITHLLFSQGDAGWFIRYHDPKQIHRKATLFFLHEFAPKCTREVFFDPQNSIGLYELVCP